MSLIVSNRLYQQDFCLWVTETIAQLKAHQFDQLDLEHLIEEIEGLAARDRRELQSRLQVLLSHLLKRVYVPSGENFRGWELTIREQRKELTLLLNQSPSLKSYWLDVFESVWQAALAEVQEDYPNTEFPEICPFPYPSDRLLSDRLWDERSE